MTDKLNLLIYYIDTDNDQEAEKLILNTRFSFDHVINGQFDIFQYALWFNKPKLAELILQTQAYPHAMGEIGFENKYWFFKNKKVIRLPDDGEEE